MKRIFNLLMLLMMVTTGAAAQSTYGSPLADTLMYLHSIANQNLMGLLGTPIKNTANIEQYSIRQILGADITACYETFENGLIIDLTVINKNI